MVPEDLGVGGVEARPEGDVGEVGRHADDAVQAGARRLQNWARDAFASVEAQILSEVNAAVPPSAAQKVIDAAYSSRPGGDITHLEWLKTSKRHGPSTLAETIDKVRFLKELGAHDWNLGAVSLAKQQAYARQVQARRPVKTREINPPADRVGLLPASHPSRTH